MNKSLFLVKGFAACHEGSGKPVNTSIKLCVPGMKKPANASKNTSGSISRKRKILLFALI
jgi:hypothetical protein